MIYTRNVDNEFEEKFELITPEIIDAYVSKYKNLTVYDLLLLDQITKMKSNGLNTLELLFNKLLDASIKIEYYEGSTAIKKIINNCKPN